MAAFQFVILIFEIGQAMSGTVNYAEELWDRQHKVEDLWNEKENHCLSTVTKDASNSECHACKVAVSVSDEDFRWERIVLHQGQRCH